MSDLKFETTDISNTEDVTKNSLPGPGGLCDTSGVDPTANCRDITSPEAHAAQEKAGGGKSSATGR